MSNNIPLHNIFIVLVIILIITIIYFSIPKSESLLDSYIKSNFTNKDFVDFELKNDYDIHYLVEQMIYKEFSPTDKKKYLNLPESLKDSYIKEYLIRKI